MCCDCLQGNVRHLSSRLLDHGALFPQRSGDLAAGSTALLSTTHKSLVCFSKGHERPALFAVGALKCDVLQAGMRVDCSGKTDAFPMQFHSVRLLAALHQRREHQFREGCGLCAFVPVSVQAGYVPQCLHLCAGGGASVHLTGVCDEFKCVCPVLKWGGA